MKNKLKLYIKLLVVLTLVNPLNIKALSSKEGTLTCKYDYKNEGINKELVYKIHFNNSVKIPFNNGENYLPSNTFWYSSDDFENTYLKSSVVEENIYTCPTITIEKSDNYITVFNNVKKECSTNCIVLQAKEQNLSKKAKQNKIKTKSIVNTQIGSSVGIYEDTNYFLPYFRMFTDGTKQWSINGKKYISTDETAIINVSKNIKTKISLNEDLIEKIYKEDKISSVNYIYRCVTKVDKNEYKYLLTLDKNKCPKDDISTKDGQATASAWHNNALGAKKADKGTTTKDMESWMDDYDKEQTCEGKNALLGDPNDENSVAWLVQKILNYIKVLGPMIIVVMSGIDFLMAIIKSDDESMAKATKKLMTRLILAISLFFVTLLVDFLLGIFGITSDPTCGLK